jgi:16S rRNA processing protein RimM
MSTATDRTPTGGEPPDGELIAVGRIGPARGVRGDVFLEPWTDAPDERFAEGARLRTGPAADTALRVAASSQASGKLVVHFVGTDDRPSAEALRGTTLYVAAADRRPLDDPDEFYITELVGLSVSTVGGDELGPVTDVMSSAGADYLVLEVDGTERLIPFVAAIVPTVDIANRRVVVDPPPGLFDL